MITLCTYQEIARDQALESFRYLAGQLRARPTPEDRAAAIAHNGGILLNAPNGAGKTFIAGSIAEKLSAEPGLPIVWFWFAPFKGLVAQSESSLRDKFPGLRMRDLRADRQPSGTESGDTWVATWQSVAARDSDARKIRADTETAPSIDTLIVWLRDAGFKIGVIVDEAHHGFGHGTQALEFFTQVLRPEFTLLVSATPDDADAEAFRKFAGFSQLRSISISRQDAVVAGLVKPGVRSVAFIAEQADQKAIVDFESTALAQGTATHRQIKSGLQAAGISLVPLMLVQVDSSTDSEKRVRDRLVALGFAESQIATHTAKEPDANLLALAVNEDKEVLIFKMAVALGFDAPRAFRSSLCAASWTRILARRLSVASSACIRVARAAVCRRFCKTLMYFLPTASRRPASPRLRKRSTKSKPSSAKFRRLRLWSVLEGRTSFKSLRTDRPYFFRQSRRRL